MRCMLSREGESIVVLLERQKNNSVGSRDGDMLLFFMDSRAKFASQPTRSALCECEK